MQQISKNQQIINGVLAPYKSFKAPKHGEAYIEYALASVAITRAVDKFFAKRNKGITVTIPNGSDIGFDFRAQLWINSLLQQTLSSAVMYATRSSKSKQCIFVGEFTTSQLLDYYGVYIDVNYLLSKLIYELNTDTFFINKLSNLNSLKDSLIHMLQINSSVIKES